MTDYKNPDIKLSMDDLRLMRDFFLADFEEMEALDDDKKAKIEDIAERLDEINDQQGVIVHFGDIASERD